MTQLNLNIDEIADEVIRGNWGNGAERKKKLTDAGFNYHQVQDFVNKKLNGTLTEDDYLRDIFIRLPDTDDVHLNSNYKEAELIPKGTGSDTVVKVPNVPYKEVNMKPQGVLSPRDVTAMNNSGNTNKKGADATKSLLRTQQFLAMLRSLFPKG